MLNVQTLGILLRALRDGQSRPDALRAPSPVAGAARVRPVADHGAELSREAGMGRPLPAQVLPGAPASVAAVDWDESAAAYSRSESTVAPAEAHADTAMPGTARGASLPAAHAGTESIAFELSPTGRLLAAVQLRRPAATPTDVPRTAPLTASPAASPSTLATALANAVATSGVFYEAHLARWVADTYPRAALAEEPQAQWTSSPQASAAGASPARGDGDVLPLLQRQLGVLETNTFTWAGTTWPGQNATIAFDDYDAAGEGPERKHEPAARTWRSRLVLTLPSLGEVSASLALVGDGVELRLTAATPASAARVAAARRNFEAALAARSLTLSGFVVGNGDGH